MFINKAFWVIGSILVLLLFSLGSAEACPGCGVANDSTVGQGFNMSIAFMMAMPFIVFGSIAAGLIYYQYQKRKPHATEPQHSPSKRGEEH